MVGLDSSEAAPRTGVRSARTIRRRRRRAVRLLRTFTVVAAVLIIFPGWSIVGALRAPGTDTTAARLAEWGRDHGLGWAVDALEQVQYDLNPPAVGGTVAGGIPTVPSQAVTASAAPTKSSTPTTTPTPNLDAAPAPIAAQTSPALPGEGAWHTLFSVNGQVAARSAFVRPDSTHTSYLVGVVWMDPHLLTFDLHAGYSVPGAVPGVVDQIPSSQRSSILATFNSGFKMVDAQGGYWQNGHSIVPLRTGAASMVFNSAGGIDIQAWPGGTPPPYVVAVRQNLGLLVDNGKATPAVNNPSSAVWGRTIGGANYVWRSALGIRADGSLVFVVGPALSVRTLANIVLAAGAQRAMELDINPDWTNYLMYHHTASGGVTPVKLTQDEQPNPYRYLQPSSRDFVAVLPR